MKAAIALTLATLAAACQAGMGGNPGAAAYNLELGTAYLGQGRVELAREKLIRATRQNPRSSEAHRMLGMAYENLGDSGGAERHYQRAVRLAPKDAEALNSLGVYRCRQPGKKEQGLKLLERAAQHAPAARRAAMYANCGLCGMAQDPAGAAQWFRRALSLDPAHSEARLLLDRLEMQTNQEIR